LPKPEYSLNSGILENQKHQIEFSGRVVEILEHAGQKKIRVCCMPDTFMLTIKDAKEYYLGEMVLIKAKLSIENIQENVALN